jgi:uncharacterized protein YjdB
MRASTLLLCASLAACAGVDHIEIDPKAPVLKRRGESLDLACRVYKRKGVTDPRLFCSWRSEDPLIATVDEKTGRVGAIASGIARIVATHGNAEARVPVEVRLVEAVRVTPAELELHSEGDPKPVRVEGLGADGRPLRDREARLVSTDNEVAHVDTSGQIWGGKPGETVVKAIVDDKEEPIKVRVVAAPAPKPVKKVDKKWDFSR